jgi:vesicle-fusing ATPase
MDYRSFQMKVVIKSVECVDLTVFEKSDSRASGPTSSGAVRGILTPETSIVFYKASDSNIMIKASAKRPPPNAIIQPDFKFEDMGIGGLDSEFGAIFRRAFASRIFPPGLVEKLGIQHVKGTSLLDAANFRNTVIWTTWYGENFDGATDRENAQRQRTENCKWS